MVRQISVSTLNVKDIASFLSKLQNETIRLKNIDKDSYEFTVHFDIMDNKFVNNKGTDISCIGFASKIHMFSDVHLMVKRPLEDGYIDSAIKYGANRITIHYEIDNFEKVLKYLKSKGVEVGVAIKPSTDVSAIENYSNYIDFLLIMSVEPGFGGQKYIENTNAKIIKAIKMYPNLRLQVDGGINFETIKFPIEQGINSIVIGNFLTSDEKLLTTKLTLLNIQKDILLEKRNENINFSKNILQIKEGGYCEANTLLGVRTPNMRSIAKKWYKNISFDVLNIYISSNIHEFKQFAVYSLIYMFDKTKDIKLKKDIYEYCKKNIEYINNWDLTDIIAPNIFGKYLITKENNYYKNEIEKFVSSAFVWEKRIGIVLLLTFARNSNLDIIFEILDEVIYEEFHLYQKATGWVLRESYKKNKDRVFKYLYDKSKKRKIPSICLSYACEKMSKEEKEKIRKINI